MSTPTVFLLDVDNTLLDNDRFASDLRAQMKELFGQGECDRYWSLYEQLRDTVGYADYLGALQHFRRENDDRPGLLAVRDRDRQDRERRCDHQDIGRECDLRAALLRPPD